MLAEQRPAERRIHADITRIHVELVRTDDPDFAQFAAFGLEFEPGAEIDPVAVSRWPVDDRQALESLTQVPDATVNFAQALLAVGVFRIFRAVALRGGGADRLGDARPFDAPQFIELRAQARRAGRRRVLRSGFFRRPPASQSCRLPGRITVHQFTVSGRLAHYAVSP